MENSLDNIPRIDLHCHLDGSLSHRCIEELLGRPINKKQLRAEDDCGSLAEYLEKFALPLSCMQTKEGLRRAGYDFMEQIAEDHIRYVEVRFAPQLSREKGLNNRQVIESVIEGLNEGMARFGIHYGVIVCAMRHLAMEENLEMLNAAREFLGAGVCGADLAGNEGAYPMNDFVDLFKKVRKMNMPFTIHAGECGSVENVVEAVKCGASRIGHGIALSGNKEAMKLCKENKIGIEMCPISNLQTKAVKNREEYPMGEFLKEKLLVTINTDNRTVSGTTLEREVEFVQRNYGITQEEIREMMKNAVHTSFAPDHIKNELLREFA